MDEQGETKELTGIIVKDMQLEMEADLLKSDDMEMFRQKLIEVINLLLHKDYHRLVNAMYRLDIDEKSFRDVISGLHSPNVAARLAELIISRELEKVKTRRKYK